VKTSKKKITLKIQWWCHSRHAQNPNWIWKSRIRENRVDLL